MTEKQVKCNNCGKTLKWPPWTGQKSLPVELDGSRHICPEYQSRNGSTGTSTSIQKKDITFDALKSKLNRIEELVTECLAEIDVMSK